MSLFPCLRLASALIAGAESQLVWGEKKRLPLESAALAVGIDKDISCGKRCFFETTGTLCSVWQRLLFLCKLDFQTDCCTKYSLAADFMRLVSRLTFHYLPGARRFMQMREAKKKNHLPMSELSSFDQVDERSRQHGCVPSGQNPRPDLLCGCYCICCLLSA